jgi:2-dehydro-3-deoxyphosphogluconate aldolase / (4S)-4-hydroxy-2-oxoglutarate aldolase
MTRPRLPHQVTDARLVVVARRLDRSVLERLMIVAGDAAGVVLEITMDAPDALDDIRWAIDAGATVGAGTVLNIADAAAAIDAGAGFLVSPYLDEALVEWAAERGHPVAPGALTPTEVVRAWALGATAVKVFPASVVGANLLRELRGPLGHIPLMPTGGVNADNARSFIDAGAVAVGVGSWLTGSSSPELARRWSALVAAVTP